MYLTNQNIGLETTGWVKFSHLFIVSVVQEELEQVQSSVLAMRGIISLLVQSTITPKPGNPSNSTCDHWPRDKSLIFLHTRYVISTIYLAVMKYFRTISHKIDTLNKSYGPFTLSGIFSISSAATKWVSFIAMGRFTLSFNRNATKWVENSFQYLALAAMCEWSIVVDLDHLCFIHTSAIETCRTQF